MAEGQGSFLQRLIDQGQRACSGMKPLSAKGGKQVKCHHIEFQFPYSTSEVPCQSFGDRRLFEEWIHCHSKGFEIIFKNVHYSAGFRFQQTSGHKGMSNSVEACCFKWQGIWVSGGQTVPNISWNCQRQMRAKASIHGCAALLFLLFVKLYMIRNTDQVLNDQSP